MRIDFIKVDAEEIKKYFPEFYTDNKEFFEINKDFKPIGFYGIKKLMDGVGEISVYINQKDKKEITKGITVHCLRHPFSLGFKQILISTELNKMKRFLLKMARLGVRYVVEHNNIYWFEVSNEF